MKVVLFWGLGGTIEGFWVGDFKAQITVAVAWRLGHLQFNNKTENS